jgi:hypothetical protein
MVQETHIFSVLVTSNGFDLLKPLIILVLILFTSCEAYVSGATQTLPNLTVAEIYPTWNEQASTPILPGLKEQFRIYVLVTNSGGEEARNAALDLKVSWGGANAQGPTEYQHSVDVESVSDAVAYFGPFVADSPTNMTVLATINPNRTIQESDYSDNSMTATFHVGKLFPTASLLSAGTLWHENETPSFYYTDPYGFDSGNYDNRLHVTMSRNGEIVAVRSDSGHISLYKNGTMIYDLQSAVSSDSALSNSGKYFAVLTGPIELSIELFDVEQLALSNKAPLASVSGVTKLGMDYFNTIAVSDNGTLAIAGFSSISSYGTLKVIGDPQKFQNFGAGVSWGKVFDGDFPHFGPNFYYLIESVSFDDTGQLVVGLTGFYVGNPNPPLSRLYGPNPWLYLLDSFGNVVWTGNVSSRVSGDSAISSDGKALLTATEDGGIDYFDRSANTRFSLFLGFNTGPMGRIWSWSSPIAISPGGDYLAVADSSSIYILDTTGAPLFMFPMSNVTSLALGGGYLVAGRLGGAEEISLWQPVDQAIVEAQSTINQALGAGTNVTQAESILASAQEQRRDGEWYKAYAYAESSIIVANQALASRTVVAPTATSSSTLPSGPLPAVFPIAVILPIGIAVVILVAVTLLLSVRRKHRKTE